MKPIISKTVYNTLERLNSIENSRYSQQVKRLLDTADVRDNEEALSGIIQINSLIELEDISCGRIIKIKLTLPGNANVKENMISVTSPLGACLLGYKEEMTIECNLPIGVKKYKINKVENSDIINK